MAKVKTITLALDVAKSIERSLDKFERLTCIGCTGKSHEPSCPAKDAFQLRNWLTQAINNPDKAHS